MNDESLSKQIYKISNSSIKTSQDVFIMIEIVINERPSLDYKKSSHMYEMMYECGGSYT